MCVCVCVCVYIYIYIYIYNPRNFLTDFNAFYSYDLVTGNGKLEILSRKDQLRVLDLEMKTQ